jgi:hypothetical protein
MNSKKPGRTLNIRVNPKDCMATYDVILMQGLNPMEMTFSTAVARCYAMFMEGLRRCGGIPIREGFEFNDLMASFMQPTTQPVKFTKEILQGLTGDVNQQVSISPATEQQATDYLTTGTGIRKTMTNNELFRWRELMTKNQYAPDTMSPEDKAELEELWKKV